jgi:predicted permease
MSFEIRPRIRRAFRIALRRRHLTATDVDAELELHLELRIQQLVSQGFTRDEAIIEAQRRFGASWDQVIARLHAAGSLREEQLSMSERFEALTTDLRYAARTLVRQRGFSAVVIATFVLGIGANATMFGVVDRLLFRAPAHIRNPDQIVMLVAGFQDREPAQRSFNYPAYTAIRDRARGFEGVIATVIVDMSIGRGEEAQRAKGMLASGNYFSMLGVRPAIGRFFSPDEDRAPLGAPVAVVSYGFWTRHFSSDPGAIGRSLDLGQRPFTVIGVAPPHFTGLEFDTPDIWIPMSSAGSMQPFGAAWATNTQGSWLRIFARLKPSVPGQLAADDALRLTREVAPDAFFAGKEWRFGVAPLMKSRANEQGASASVTALLGGMTLIVLLICCANVANLMLARGLRRRREIAVRLALGVSRGRLVAQLLTESVVLALLGSAVALLVAYWGGHLMRSLLFADVTLTGSPVDGRVLAFTFTIAVLTGVVTGLIPAWQTSRPELTTSLKAGAREGGGRRSRLRAGLLIVQTALSLVLLVGAGLFVRSLTRLNAVRLGVDVDRVLIGTMDLRSTGRPQSVVDDVFARAAEKVRGVPGVTNVALGLTVPFGPSWGTGVLIPGRDSVIDASAMFNAVTPEYFTTLGARVLRGRDFKETDTESSTRVAVINEMLATRYWRGSSPLGECVRIGSDTVPCVTIVGVVENVRRQSIFEDSTGAIYVPLVQGSRRIGWRQLVARVNGSDPARSVDLVRRAMQTAAPGLPFADVHLVSDESTVRSELRPFRLGASMFGIFGGIALLLAAVGIYGVVSFSVAQRMQEMGIRIALGAQARDIAKLVMREGVGMTAIGAGLGAVIALLGARYVAAMLFEVPARDPIVLSVVATSLLVVAVVACLVPAWRAMRVDAVISLRSE